MSLIAGPKGTAAEKGVPVVALPKYLENIGYRLPGRRAELSVGVLNLNDRDYRLEPLTLYQELPHRRTAVMSFRFYF